MNSASSVLTLAVRESPATIQIDSVSGLPQRLSLDGGADQLVGSLRTSLEFLVGGVEARNPVGGLEYLETVSVTEIRLISDAIRRVHNGDSIDLELDAMAGDLSLVLIYRMFPTSPNVEFSIRLSVASAPVVVRDLRARVEACVAKGTEILLNAPGNHVRRDLPLSQLESHSLAVSPLGGLEGSSGVIICTAGDTTVTVWPNGTGEILDVFAERISDDTALIRAAGLYAGELRGTDEVRVRVATFDISAGGFLDVREGWPAWASRYGLTSPPGKPLWAAAASLFEAQVGPAPFRGGHVNEPYPSIAAITRDLDRIHGLGFSVIQLMPRQPYPSYNVHDYWDVDTTYGDSTELTTLVGACHDRGMAVILDVLLHGVLDKESMDETVQGVINGPYFDRLDEELRDVFVQTDRDAYLIAWSRHILDFADAWREGAPDVNTLEIEHPDWFFRDSAGQVTGVYTKAFDARNPEMQRYFRAAMVFLMTELGIDGFRFDAPTYNYFANWAPWARLRASASPLACVALFEDMRRDIKKIHPQALMYTEPSGHLLRRSMDLNYNYDESWLVSSLGRGVPSLRHWVRNAAEFMRWHEDRDAFLPVGSMTAHHVDSHDSFWWSDWGSKWRREQFAIERVQSLTAAFLALDGPFMMFVGGEAGVEDVLSALNGIRRSHPGLWDSPGRFHHRPGQSAELFWMQRTEGTRRVDVLVNLAGNSTIRVAAADLPTHSQLVFSTRSVASADALTLEIDGIAVFQSEVR